MQTRGSGQVGYHKLVQKIQHIIEKYWKIKGMYWIDILWDNFGKINLDDFMRREPLYEYAS
jgi:hypothetical protein